MFILLLVKSIFDVNRLKDAESVTPPKLQPNEPKEFVTKAWLDDAVLLGVPVSERVAACVPDPLDVGDRDTVCE